MKKRIFAIVLSLLLTVSLFACEKADSTVEENTSNVTSTTEGEKVTTPEETTEDIKPITATLTLTQKSTVKNEDYIGQSKYAEFLNLSEKTYIVPALEQNTIPQGLARSPSDGRIYVSSYSGESNSPSVILVMNSKGDFVAEYFLYNADGTPFTGHVGGIAVTEHYMYIAVGGNGKGAYCLGEFKLADLPRYGSHTLKIKDKVNIPSGTAYLAYSDGILFTGNFYLKGSYDLGTKFNFTTTVDGKAYGGYAAAYFLDENNEKLSEDKSLGYAKPDFVFATPDKVQGFAYKDGKIYLSISYGRKNDSYIQIYSASVLSNTKTVKMDGKEYPFETLGNSNLQKSIRTIPMSEGLTFDADGKLLILYESAAIKYSDSLCPTDRIWKLDF